MEDQEGVLEDVLALVSGEGILRLQVSDDPVPLFADETAQFLVVVFRKFYLHGEVLICKLSLLAKVGDFSVNRG